MLAEKHSAVWATGTGSMTYREYVERHLFPGDNDNDTIKTNRKNCYARFLDFLNEQNHPLREQIESEASHIRQRLSSGNIFSSFINLINDLNTNHSNYTIVLRAFGHDLSAVIRELESRTSLRFGTVRVRHCFKYQN